ncbi:hypothetical protein B0H11DRAFT_2287527 [Mycena galericulata]|nr:hypothetical protein B0H11DRAFT_2287527 [Mycena galericulata]
MTTSDVRPSKRPREDSLVLNPSVRDDDFYNESGDCILCVENTLFKVHRYLLMRDSPVFSGLFSLPQDGVAEEGLSNELPIFLRGDKAADFRALFKYIYAPAHETQVAMIPDEQLLDIVAVSHFAHKYEMSSWQQWSGMVITDFLTGRPESLLSGDFVALYELFHKLSDEKMRSQTTQLWLKRIERNWLPILDALNAAEAHNDRAFLALLYERQLGHMPVTASNGGALQPSKLDTTGIAPIHLQRIFAGYWSFTQAWASFRRAPPRLPYLSDCDREDHVECEGRLRDQWDYAVKDAQAERRLGALRERISVTMEFFKHPSGLCQDHVCEAEWLAELMEMWDDLPKTLEGHFFISEPASAINPIA